MPKMVKRTCPACGKKKKYRDDNKTCGCQGTNPQLVEPKTLEPETAKPFEESSDEHNGTERTIKRVVQRDITTIEELAEVCHIDLSIWEIYRWKCGTWSTGMKPPAIGKSKKWKRKSGDPIYSRQYVVMAWMRLKQNIVAANDEIAALAEKAKNYAPKYPAIIRTQELKVSDVLVEYAPMDIHHGALIWGQETGHENWDIKISRKAHEAAMLDLIDRAKFYNADKALLILGNDQQNFDNKRGTTTLGTPQDTDARYQKVFSVSCDVSIWAIEALMGHHREVEVVLMPGNHDALAAWHLGHSLQAWFHKAPNVKIDNTPLYRKYYQFGVNMFMFTHGNVGKLENYGKIMAAEKPEMWGKTLWREAHTGDKHHRRTIELNGATVRILPSLRPPDAWSSEHQFVGSIRGAESYVWHRSRGLLSTNMHSILDASKG